MQQREREATVSLLQKRLGSGALTAEENAELRKAIASLVYTLSIA